MDYTPPYYRPKFWTRKIENFKRAEKLKNGVLGPPQAENFWGPKPIMDYTPPYYRQISNKGGIVLNNSID